MTHLDELQDLMRKFINRPLIVYGDPDVDGIMAMLLACQFLDSQRLQYSYFINSDRVHGFTLHPSALSGYFVIAVDFDIPQDVMQSLVDNDVAVICLDHHKVQDEFIHCRSNTCEAEGIVINNQYPFEPREDTYLSGAGVVYEALSTCYPEFKDEVREAIVGITLLSDARPIENPKAKKYLRITYSSDPQTGYMGYLISSVLKSDYNFGVPRMDRNFIDYTFSPRVNALLRFNKETDAIDFILGKGLPDDDYKQMQSELVLAMKEKAMVLEMENVTIIGINSLDFKDYKITNFIGLLCSDIKGTGKSVLGFVFENGVVTRASFRGKFDDIDYLSGFQSLGIDAKGHPPAFGIKNFVPTNETWTAINELIGKLNESHTITAKIYSVSNLGMFITQRGMVLANENCYVRDMYRSYIDYKGSNIREIKRTYKSQPFTSDDYMTGVVADFESKGEKYKYVRGTDGKPITKYIEYQVDGQKVKSFGLELEDGIILPILEKGYIQLYVRERIE